MSYLIDTSVWIEHFAGRDQRLAPLLAADKVVIHPWIIGEIAFGNLGPMRGMVLQLLSSLRKTPFVTDGECLALIDRQGLGGRGIGWVDTQLLASVLLESGVTLLTRDKRLAALAALPMFSSKVGAWD